MDVGVAVLAKPSDIGEDGFYVTLSTGQGLVHAAQRIPCLVVIKLGNSTDRPPAIRRMAILAWDIEVSVGTVRASAGNLRPSRCRTYGKSH